MRENIEKKMSDAQSTEELAKLQAKIKNQAFNYLDFQIGLKIGQGAFALVRRVVHKKSGHVVALKTYEKKNISGDA